MLPVLPASCSRPELAHFVDLLAPKGGLGSNGLALLPLEILAQQEST
jgi:hypothetical protein